MGNLILFAILVVFSSNLYHFSYCGGGISDLFYSFDCVQLKNAVSIRNTNSKLSSLGEFVFPHFEASWAERIVMDYFDTNIRQFLKGPGASYQVKVDFGLYTSYKTVTYGLIKAYPKQFSFLLEASFGGVYSFRNSRTFRIEKGAVNG